MSKKRSSLQFGSVCVKPMRTTKKVLPHTEPIYATTAYTFDSPEEAIKLFEDQFSGYIYSRLSNPTVEMAEIKIADLETFGTDIKARAQLFSSGMAAISSAMLACLKNGEKLITQSQLYGTTDELIQTQLQEFGIGNVRADMHDLNKVEDAIKKDRDIKLIYIETPSNPMLQVFDIAELSSLSKIYKIKLAVDNTFSSPYCQQPLKSGADISIHSATKYLNGHGSGLGGVVIGSDIDFMKKKVWPKLKMLGANSNAFEAWLILQGLKTLEIRMQRHCTNAKKVAEFLNGHKKVTTVNYCGSKDHPQHKIIKKQMTNYSGMLSFELKGGLKAGINLMKKVNLCSMITTLGTLDTLIQHPASMTHVNVPRERRMLSGITDGLVRMSVGIENVEDIIGDLEKGMKG